MQASFGKQLLLERYRQNFSYLSGKEINQEVHHFVENVFPQRLKSHQLNLQKLRQAVDRSLVNFISERKQMQELMRCFDNIEQALSMNNIAVRALAEKPKAVDPGMLYYTAEELRRFEKVVWKAPSRAQQIQCVPGGV